MAVDVNDYDLFMDIHHAAVRRNAADLAHAALIKVRFVKLVKVLGRQPLPTYRGTWCYCNLTHLNNIIRQDTMLIVKYQQNSNSRYFFKKSCLMVTFHFWVFFFYNNDRNNSKS